MKRASGRLIAVVIVVLIGVGAALAFWTRFQGGSRGLEPFRSSAGEKAPTIEGGAVATRLGKIVVGIVNRYLEPQLAFDGLRYEAPGTLLMTGATLIATDGTRVFEMPEFEITLAERPKRNQPIKIESVRLTGGRLVLQRDAQTGAIKGLTNLVKQKDSGNTTASQDTPPKPKSGEETRLSQLLQLRHVLIEDAAISYHDGSDGPPMILRGLSADMRVTEDPDEPAWYDLTLDSGRPPNLTLKGDARLNLDTFDLALDGVRATLDLTEHSIESLPPALQTLCAEYDVTGTLAVDITANLSLKSPLTSEAGMQVEATDVRFAAGSLQTPIQRITLDAGLDSGVLMLRELRAEAFDGVLSLTGDSNLASEDMLTTLSWNIEGVRLNTLVRADPSSQVGANAPANSSPEAPADPEPASAAESDQTSTQVTPETAPPEAAPKPDPKPAPKPGPKLAGVLISSGKIRTALLNPFASMGGGGELTIERGRLLMLPGLTQLADLLAAKPKQGDARESNHRAQMAFSFTPEGIRVDSSKVLTNLLAASGKGLIGWDKSLNLDIDAGALKRLQEWLWLEDTWIAQLGDQVYTYQLRGTLADPQVSVEAIGMNDASDDK